MGNSDNQRFFGPEDLTFAVTAYGESSFLEDCVRSLQNQTVACKVILCTATPNDLICRIAKRYGLELFVKEEAPSIASDWNYALSCIRTPLAVLAHQDDIYCAEYAQSALDALSNVSRPLIFFCNYGEIRNGELEDDSALLETKRKLLRPLVGAVDAGAQNIKRKILRFGNPICCPSVAYDLESIQLPLFKEGMRSNIDWEAWEALSREQGSFVYVPRILMYHRVHNGSETSACIDDGIRTSEDLNMLKKFWPAPMASLINKAYAVAQKLN